MPTIRRLSQSLVNKIAAGEVIERPASVVKELMENAVDAGAGRIDVTIRGGGSELIRVVDNGAGILPDELPLAVASHATSKIAEADDLFRVGTLGFRGEALASIGEVSRLGIRSRTPDSPSGAGMEVVGGQASAATPCGCPVGTAVEVANLFYNMPVRRKFLRSTQTELGHISEAFTRIALAAPQIHFTLRHNDRLMHDLPATPNWCDRIGRLLGRQIAENLIAVQSTDRSVQLSGYVAHPSQSRSNNRMQYVFLNGRHIRDRALQHALGEAYRGLLLSGRYPIAVLSLRVPPEMVDVNVHPTKLEVRFQDSGRIYSQLLSTLRTKFLSSNLDTRVGDPGEDDPSGAHDQQQAAQLRQRVVDWAKGEVAAWQPSGDHPPGPPAESPGGGPLEVTRLDRAWPAAGRGDSRGAEPVMVRVDPGRDQPGSPCSPHPPPKALQVHNRYLVAESDDGVMVIDQHALHERVLYEQLRARVAAGPIEAQALLVPEPVDLSPTEAATALEQRELLARLGLKIEPFGGDTVIVSSYPAMLANLNPAEVLHGLLERLLAGATGLEPRDMLDELLHSVACKAAVKAGDRLEPEEIAALLAQRHLVHDTHHCPHGRPTALIFSRQQLDKQFKRT